MNNYLLDANVIHALTNIKDINHNVCKAFFEEHSNKDAFFVPINGAFELQASLSRRKRGNDFDAFDCLIKNMKFVDINRKLLDTCISQGLLHKFDKLKGADLIYACVAEIGKFTLVTCDSDFDAYKETISIQKI
jgi:predicted nucleic acid-binding protein